MKKLLALAVAALSLVAYADRTDVWSAASVKVSRVDLIRTADGGCAVRAYATFTKSDGGAMSDGSELTPVNGANLVTCMDILDTKSPALFKVDKGL